MGARNEDGGKADLTRRQFVRACAAAAAAAPFALPVAGRGQDPAAAGPTTKTAVGGKAAKPGPKPSPSKIGLQGPLPCWHGFNLQEMYLNDSKGDFQENDFRWISDWGFDFVRFPLCYLLWTDPLDVLKTREAMLAKLDRAVDFGRKYHLHVCLNFHKAPGYSVDSSWKDPFVGSLWRDSKAQEAFAFHWGMLAGRYKGIPSSRLSFNLVNEPPLPGEIGMSAADHERVVSAAVKAIREADPQRLIILDGVRYGTYPCLEFLRERVPQSCRAYAPSWLTHWKASWSGYMDYPAPTWPLTYKTYGGTWDRERLEDFFDPWIQVSKPKYGVSVHCSEGGAYKFTPHDVVLGWLRDVLEVLTPHKIGFALWEFRGPFGVLDSGRSDVKYEDWHGHKLDRKLLNLLRAY